jgi:plastocyanin
MKIARNFAISLVVIVLLVGTASIAACSIVRAPTPTPPPDFTPRPTPGGGSDTIDVTATDFVQHTLTVKRGTNVTFVIRLDSGPHILCLGKNGHCDPSLPGPPELSQDGGFSVDAGQSLTVDFAAPGVYPITDSIYPSMNTVITVT